MIHDRLLVGTYVNITINYLFFCKYRKNILLLQKNVSKT